MAGSRPHPVTTGGLIIAEGDQPIAVATLAPADHEQAALVDLLHRYDFNTVAATPSPSLRSPRRRCSVRDCPVSCVTGRDVIGCPDQLVCYLGLNPKVKRSGNAPATHGRITKAGPAQARGTLVEAAFAASRTPGPRRAFRRGGELRERRTTLGGSGRRRVDPSAKHPRPMALLAGQLSAPLVFDHKLMKGAKIHAEIPS